MGEKANRIDFISNDPTPSELAREAEQKGREPAGLSAIVRNAESQFTTPEGKKIFAEELSKELALRKNDLSPALREYVEGTDGVVDLKKVEQIYGLSEDFKAQEQRRTPGTFAIPERPTSAKGGSELFREWGLNRDMNAHQEELTRQIIQEIEKGNVPDSCRNMRTITMQGKDGTKISFRTSAGYLAVGSNTDHVRVPLSGPMAKQIADHFGWVLPTASMAATTDAQADVQLRIGGETHTQYDLDHMADLEYARKHNERAQKALDKYMLDYNKRAKAAGQPELTASELSRRLIRGEKKNIFIGQRSTAGGIGIGGLLDSRGNPIQPYQYPHSAEKGPKGEPGFHGDYSQSIAINEAMVTPVTRDGKTLPPIHLYDALRDPNYARILNASEAATNGGSFDAEVAYMAPGTTPPPRRPSTGGSRLA